MDVRKEVDEKPIQLTGYVLFALTGMACFICLICVCLLLWGQFYKETLRLQGYALITSGLVFPVLFVPIWYARLRAIDLHLKATYGEECCKPIRVPVLVLEAKSQDGKGSQIAADEKPTGDQ